jgi:hypothetical protein
MRDVLRICRKSGASSVLARIRERWYCTTHPGWPRSRGMCRLLLRRDLVLGHSEIVLAIRRDEEYA